METYTDRELDEIRFALRYVAEYNHGTDGHSRLCLIAKLAGHCSSPLVQEVVEDELRKLEPKVSID